MQNTGDKNRKKNRKSKENKKEANNNNENEKDGEEETKNCIQDLNKNGFKKNCEAKDKKDWTTSIRKRPFNNEFDAFAKYYEGCKDDNSIMEMAHQADILALTNYCDLYEGVKMPEKSESLLNIDQKPLKKYNDKILYASNLVKINQNQERGRHLVAYSRIEKNDIIITEEATVLQVEPLCSCIGEEGKLYRCHNCASVCSIFFTCNSCNIVVYCSLKCLRKANKLYHKYECEGLQRHYWSMEDTDYSYIAMRMMLYGAINNFDINIENIDIYGSEENNYPFIYRLQTNFDKLPLGKIEQILETSVKTLVYLICRTNFFEQFDYKNDTIRSNLYLYVGGLLVRHYCQAQANNVLLKFPNLKAGYGFDVVSGRGKAICPTIALLNHSCSPNAVIIPYNNRVVVKTIKTVREGEEITICYNEVCAFLTIKDRNTITEEIFYFTCKCTYCEFERTWDKYPYKCPSCSNGKAKKVILSNKEYGFCITCNEYFNMNLKSEKLAVVCSKLYRATYDLEHVLRIAECYDTLYPRNSLMLLDVYKLLYDKYSVWGEKPIEVIKYGLLTFSILEHYIPRLYLPLLVAKLRFFFSVVNNEKFITMKKIMDRDFDIIRMFCAEVTRSKKDVLFYLPIQFTDFYFMNLLVKIEQAQYNLEIVNEKDQEPKSL